MFNTGATTQETEQPIPDQQRRTLFNIYHRRTVTHHDTRTSSEETRSPNTGQYMQQQFCLAREIFQERGTANASQETERPNIDQQRIDLFNIYHRRTVAAHNCRTYFEEDEYEVHSPNTATNDQSCQRMQDNTLLINIQSEI
ncbi:uncharacterized protein LOC102804389 [Saccoglossus kowalevskii]